MKTTPSALRSLFTLAILLTPLSSQASVFIECQSVSNCSFEEALNPDGSIPGWEMIDGSQIPFLTGEVLTEDGVNITPNHESLFVVIPGAGSIRQQVKLWQGDVLFIGAARAKITDSGGGSLFMSFGDDVFFSYAYEGNTPSEPFEVFGGSYVSPTTGIQWLTLGSTGGDWVMFDPVTRVPLGEFSTEIPLPSSFFLFGGIVLCLIVLAKKNPDFGRGFFFYLSN